jgi:hypothetical protein
MYASQGCIWVCLAVGAGRFTPIAMKVEAKNVTIIFSRFDEIVD